MEQYHFFYSEREPECSVFTNFFRTTYKLYGKTFKSSEQGFMYKKALVFNDKDVALAILAAKTPREAKDLGKTVKGFTDEVWNTERKQAMFENCYAKFSQNKKLRKALMATGDQILVEASPNDCIWGIGYNMKDAPRSDPSEWGSNLLGKTLCRVRETMTTESK